VHEEQLAQHPLVVRAVGLGAPRVELLKRRLELPLHDLAARRTPKRSELHAFWKVVSENISFGLIFLGSNGQIRDENSVVHASVSILILYEK
jgi:hypothetical protein